VAYPFDVHLLEKVLADGMFQRTGKYTGKWTSYRYAVIDPRRHNIDVWTKTQDGQFLPTQMSRYRDSARTRSTIFSTNGPPMEPPHFFGEDHLTGEKKIYAGFGFSVASGTPWEPYDAVRSGGQVLHAGRGNIKWVFERTGQGQLSVYRIAQATANGIEALSGCYGIVSAGAIIDSEDHDGLKRKDGCAAWCLRPLAPPMDTSQWESTVPWLEGVRADTPLDGVIIAVAVGIKPRELAAKIVEVGCTAAVAMDGSTSTLCGMDGAVRIECEPEKDLVQRWGLYCT
jgi:hypothetical protein